MMENINDVSKPKFSIIVPVYNVENYLQECVQSLLNQTFENYELLLVDDGSTDSSGKMCDEFSSIDNRIVVVHKANGGLSSARNTGLDKVNGEFIIFIDSDDFIYGCDSLEQISQKLVETGADVLIYNMRRYYTETDTYTDIVTDKVNCQLIDRSEPYKALTYMIEANLFRASACNKVVKRSLIEENNMRFMEGFLSEDLDWCGKLLLYSLKYAYLDLPVYSYRQQRTGSITSNKQADKLIRDKLYMCMIGFKEAIKQEDKQKEWLLGSYYAYEYAVLIGISGGVNKELVYEMEQMERILDFDLCKKVKMVKKVCKLIGFKPMRWILCEFVKYKK